VGDITKVKGKRKKKSLGGNFPQRFELQYWLLVSVAPAVSAAAVSAPTSASASSVTTAAPSVTASAAAAVSAAASAAVPAAASVGSVGSFFFNLFVGEVVLGVYVAKRGLCGFKGSVASDVQTHRAFEWSHVSVLDVY